MKQLSSHEIVAQSMFILNSCLHMEIVLDTDVVCKCLLVCLFVLIKVVPNRRYAILLIKIELSHYKCIS